MASSVQSTYFGIQESTNPAASTSWAPGRGCSRGLGQREKLPRQYLWLKTLPWQDPALALSVVHYKCMPGRGTPLQSLPTGLGQYRPTPGDVWMMCQPGHLSLLRLSDPAQWPQMAEGNVDPWGLQIPPRKLAADSNSSQVRALTRI